MCHAASSFFFFNDTATTEIYTLSHTTLFRSRSGAGPSHRSQFSVSGTVCASLGRSSACGQKGRLDQFWTTRTGRSEEHTSELQSHVNLVCRLLLEKKKKKI